jgi:flagellar biosynthesis protein FlhF
VLSATSETDQLRDELARYRSLRPDALIVTKLDETRSWAGMANVLLDDDAPPLLWAANGQRVPEDLLLPEPAVLADGLLRDDGRVGTGRPA